MSSIPTFASVREMARVNPDGDVWSDMIAPFIASKLFECSKIEAYEDVRLIPPELQEYTNEMLTLLVRKSGSEKVSRVYLWVGTRDEAKMANCLLESNVGRFVVVQTVIPHDVEFYNKYEIIQESDEGGMFSDLEVNKVLVSTPSGVKRLEGDALVDLIQHATEAFVAKLMELEESGNDLLGLFVTVRVMRRGDSTLFDETDILIGDRHAIRDLREAEDSDSSNADSDYSTTSERAEAAATRSTSSGELSKSSESCESCESSGSSESGTSESDESDGSESDDDESRTDSDDSSAIATEEDEDDDVDEEDDEDEDDVADEDRLIEEAKIMSLLPLFNEFVENYSPESVSDASLRVLLDKMKMIGTIRMDMFDDDDFDMEEDPMTAEQTQTSNDDHLLAIMAALNRTSILAGRTEAPVVVEKEDNHQELKESIGDEKETA